MKQILAAAVLLFATVARAEQIGLAVSEVSADGAVLTFEAAPHRLMPMLSPDHEMLSVVASGSVFLVKREGGAPSLVSKVEQFREGEVTRMVVQFKRAVAIRGESGKRSVRLVVQALNGGEEETPRASFGLRLVPRGLAGMVAEQPGLTVVVPDLGNFGLNPLSTILRSVAFGLDWIQQAVPATWGAQNQVSNEQELRNLVRNLNIEVIELRREVMLKDEELRKRERVGL